MLKQKVNRQTLTAATWTAFEFDVKSREFVVKNFTEDDILVSLEANDQDDESILIKAGMAEVIYATKVSESPEAYYDTVYVKAAEAGDVEVQATDYGKQP